ncbi:MAG: GGDEF domain-containing protein, partial [Epsilonproteobacteria bacterium]|nr:GGDEF domain-containing protein [Campylobacterota bacterium]
MLLSEKKEREYRFRLALRMGLPIFGLILVLVFTTLINNYENLNAAFYIESILLLFVSVYFIFFMIYKGFDVSITDPVSKVFTREYFYDYMQQLLKKKDTSYTFLLISITNITDINTQYGLKNGDRVLREVAQWIAQFLESKGFHELPIGRIKSGDFIVALPGDMVEHKVILELFNLKSDALKVGSIEVDVIATMIDTNFSKKLEYIIDALYDQKEDILLKRENNCEHIDPSELEVLVIDAIKKRSLSIATQAVFDKTKEIAFYESYIRLKAKNGKFIHQKKYTKVINKLGLTYDFDTMLVEEIVKRVDKKQKNVVLNIATTTLRDVEFLKFLQSLHLQYKNGLKNIG